MRTVSAFESSLLRILHCFLEQSPATHVLNHILRSRSRPRCLSRDAIELIKQSIAVGSMRVLVTSGGWKRERFLRDDEICDDRLWGRYQPDELGLDFSPATIDLLIWITSSNASEQMPVWSPQQDETLTLGDQFLVYLMAMSMQHTSLMGKWYSSPLFRNNGLIALQMPHRFAEQEVTPEPDFEPWVYGKGGAILESLQPSLADTWVEIENKKSAISNPDEMVRLGKSQAAVVSKLMDVLENRQRRDLSRFLMEASRRSIDQSSGQVWVNNLDTSQLKISERTQVYESASALLHATRRLHGWYQSSWATGYFDEGYAESQLLKSCWEEQQMDQTIENANRVLRELSF